MKSSTKNLSKVKLNEGKDNKPLFLSFFVKLFKFFKLNEQLQSNSSSKWVSNL